MEKPCAKRENERDKMIIIINKQKQVEQWHNNDITKHWGKHKQPNQPHQRTNRPTDRTKPKKKKMTRGAHRERKREKEKRNIFPFYIIFII